MVPQDRDVALAKHHMNAGCDDRSIALGGSGLVLRVLGVLAFPLVRSGGEKHRTAEQ